MSLPRRLPRLHRIHRLGRAAAAALLLAATLAAPGWAAPGTAPVLAAPAAVAPLAPQDCPTDVWNDLDNLTAHTLREAVACATAGQTVTFLSGGAGTTISLSHGEIPITQSITIDASASPGIIVDAGDVSRVFNITTSGTVTLTELVLQNGTAAGGSGGAVLASNSVVLNQVQVLSSTAPSGEGGGLFADGTATLIDTDFISNTSAGHGGGAWVTGDAVVTNGRFERNTCTASGCQGGGLNVNGLTLTGTVFITNTSDDQGGGVWVNSTASLSNATLQGNQCTDSGCLGGGLFGSATLTVDSTDFTNNRSTGSGGGAFALDAAVLTNGSFQGNKCTDAVDGCSGGGLYGSTSLTLSGTDFISNTSGFAGGAYAEGAVVVTNGRFQGNICSAPCGGGGLFANTTLTLTGTDFINNTSTNGGGGAWAQGAVLTNGQFQGNKCTASGCVGGGLSADTLTLSGTRFLSNTSAGNGGGAFAQDAAGLTNGQFQNNQCTDSSTITVTACLGGGLYANTTLTINGTDFTSNVSIGSGGGAWAAGAALLSNGSFQGNKCTGSGCLGGGLYVDSNLTLTGTDFISNTSASHGGGAYIFGDAVLTNGRFERNTCTDSACRGGGLNVAHLTLTGTQFITNTSAYQGGGAWAILSANLTNGLFQGNKCTGSGCLGGGLFAFGTTLVLDSSFSANQSAGLGGAIEVTKTAQLTLANVTLSGNTASVSGGGLYVGATSTARLYNVTVADNQAPSGGGVAADISATLAVTNTLFSNNGLDTCAGTLVAGTHNLEFPGNTCALAGPSAGFTTADPLLAPLALNLPGTTLTRALLANSPARDHGDPVTCAAFPVSNVDQRGVHRPDAVGEACDIGAYEASGPDRVVFLPLARR